MCSLNPVVSFGCDTVHPINEERLAGPAESIEVTGHAGSTPGSTRGKQRGRQEADLKAAGVPCCS